MAYRISLVIIGFICALYYVVLVPLECGERCINTHTQIIANQFSSPWVYRVLMPFAAEFLIQNRLVSGVYTAYGALHLFLMPAALLSLYEWLRLSTSQVLALAGSITMAFFLPLFFITNYGINIGSITEVLLLSIGLLLLQSHVRHEVRLVVYAALIGISTLNRESAVFLALLYTIAQFNRDRLTPRWVLENLLLYVVWFGTLAAVHYLRGPASTMAPFPLNITFSLSDILATTVINNLLLIPLWLLAVVRWRAAPPFVKRVALLIPFYVASVLIFGIWNEIRLWLPIFPIVLAIIFAQDNPEVDANSA